MNIIGISGVHQNIAFKARELPGLSKRQYRINQGFDSAAALVSAGRVLAAAAEERFTRDKGTGEFPLRAIQYCLSAGNLRISDVDYLAHGFAYEPFAAAFQEPEYARKQYQELYAPGAQKRHLRHHFPGVDWDRKFIAVPHHVAHAASAFYPSGFEESLILVSDGMGEVHSMTVAVGQGTEIKVLKQVPALHSLGTLYGIFTLHLGFWMNMDEYKVMGLAPYGNPRRYFDKVMDMVRLKEDGTYIVPAFAKDHKALDKETHQGVLGFMAERFGPPREPNSPITQDHKDIAAALQAALQACQMHVLRHFQAETGQSRLCLAGGVALNCSLNGVIRRSRMFEQMFVQPAAGDDGSALGAALYASKLHDPGFKPRRMTVPLWGPEFRDQDLVQALGEREDCAWTRPDSFEELCRQVAERLAAGEVVAWFQGRMEFGPRALGSRSILADPRDPGMRDRINALVKKREGFRPFAPVVTSEAARRYFDIAPRDEDTFAHMLYVTHVLPAFREKLPAVTHVDGSARVQTVSREHNPRLWMLLKAFEKVSGVPIVLNTSFNVKGEPIVCTPHEALNTFRNARLDALVLGDYLVEPKRVLQAPTTLLGEAGPRQLPLESNATRTAMPPDPCIHRVIERRAAETPQAIAVICRDQQLTYGELNARANQVAAYLSKLGVGPEVLVGLCTERSLEMLVGLLGILKAGGAYVPLDPAYPQERLRFMIEDAHLTVLLTQERLEDRLALEAARRVRLDADWPLIALESEQDVDRAVAPHHLAYVIYTSGSTGKPKGVMVEHRNVLNLFVGMDERIQHGPGATWLAVTSPSFDISVLELFWTLARGFKVVLYTGEEAKTPAAPQAALPSTRPMQFSLFYFSSDQDNGPGGPYRLLIEGARFADEHNFTAVWTPERHFHEFGALYPNPAVTSAALAMITKRVQIRSGSVVAPLHSPIRIAEEWSVVDNLSNGRAAVSFASGWMPEDFALSPSSYANRKALMSHHLDVVRRLWRGERVAMPGPLGKDVPVQIFPRPVQKELPMWLTAAGNPETFQMAGKLGLNLLTHLLGQSLQEVSDKVALYRQAWKEAGHPGRGHVTLMLHTFVGESLEAVKATVREPLIEYLRASTDLIKGYAWAFSAFKQRKGLPAEVDFTGFSKEEMDALLEHSFERYFESSGLFGTAESCLRRIEELRAKEVDEVACLIDFGINPQVVLDNLKQLNTLRQAANKVPEHEPADHSVPALIQRHNVTHLQCTPTMAGLLLLDERTHSAFGRLQTLMIGGEAFPVSLARQLQAVVRGEILNMYGPTETTVWSSTYRLPSESARIPVGRPIANTEMYVLDGNLSPVPDGITGELVIGGAGVARGYLGRPDLTSERFIPDPFLGQGSRLYRTGDLARCLPDGTIEVLGRMDQQVKIRGHRVELGEIEALLNAHYAVRQAVVVAKEAANGEKRLVAYVQAHDGEDPRAQQLRQYLQGRIPEYMVPAQVLFLGSFPQTPNQKIDRNALQARPAEGIEENGAFEAPVAGVEEAIAGIWCELLEVKRVGRHENFFEAGGHSMLAMQLTAQIRRRFSVDISLKLLFEHPTVAGLAEAINAPSWSAAVEPLVPASAGREELVT